MQQTSQASTACRLVLACIHGLGPLSAAAARCRSEKAGKPVEFIIDETFGVPGVGTVVAGTVKQGVIHTNSTLLLGPQVGDGAFRPTAIKSIHYKRLPVSTVSLGARPSWQPGSAH